MGNILNKAVVIKIGGSTLGAHDTTIQDVVTLQKRGVPLVIVHGGGKVITDWLKKQGISTAFVRGQRVTDKASLEVVVAVLAGLVNKEITAAVNKAGGKAVGISGVDGALLQSDIKDPELGYVGEVTKINLKLLEDLLSASYVPVVAPIGFYSSGKQGESPMMLNINADGVAGDIAEVVGAEKLVFLTDVEGVLDGAGKLMSKLSIDDAKSLVAAGVASGGMIPKIEACLKAVSGASVTSIIDGRQPNALIRLIDGDIRGTTINS
ncbi:acetylglutamate kinase [Chloroflexota bacterium]